MRNQKSQVRSPASLERQLGERQVSARSWRCLQSFGRSGRSVLEDRPTLKPLPRKTLSALWTVWTVNGIYQNYRQTPRSGANAFGETRCRNSEMTNPKDPSFLLSQSLSQCPRAAENAGRKVEAWRAWTRASASAPTGLQQIPGLQSHGA